MKKFSVTGLSLVALLLFAGCDHSTNTQPPPAGADVSIQTPADYSEVRGTVPVVVHASTVTRMTKVELYINGQLQDYLTTAPWEFRWCTTGIRSNTFCTIYARVFDWENKYWTTQTVRVKVQ